MIKKPYTPATEGPFFFVDSIMTGKDVWDDDRQEEYVPFVINRALSYHSDCVYWAQQMNLLPGVPKKFQNIFYINTIRVRKRYGNKWPKPPDNETLNLVKENYGYSNAKALDALRILTPEAINSLREQNDKGGFETPLQNKKNKR